MSEANDVPDDRNPFRDTVPIRPLPKWASRIIVTMALLTAAALGLLAARMIRNMTRDPDVRRRLEAVERMRDGATPSDSLGSVTADSVRGRPPSPDTSL